MKFFLFLGLVTISLSICECLQCYNCYFGSTLKMNDIDQQIIKHNTITPTERCGIINNTICKTSDYCVNMVVDINSEKTFYQFCSYTHIKINKNYFNFSTSRILSITKSFCFNDFCGTLNGTYNGTFNGNSNGAFNGANFVTNNYLSIIIILVLIKLGCL
ncbi:uncharacterized protein LOC127276603 [Leptopilina boulardi]|uniref:uncharacterized protein LOC127276603 n=1 Tax=Leptopilina boulardi TaxID=63433 RepID=UPI0021F639C7|nr:uncharacterized protein LOC127276603 [Leptopilina boulardi]